MDRKSAKKRRQQAAKARRRAEASKAEPEGTIEADLEASFDSMDELLVKVLTKNASTSAKRVDLNRVLLNEADMVCLIKIIHKTIFTLLLYSSHLASLVEAL